MEVVAGPDGKLRCEWGSSSPDYVAYHDREWGRATTDDRLLYEKLSLEGFQAGLSWSTILRKRPTFRTAFAGFDPERVAAFGERDVARLLADPGIVRHEGKVRAAIGNAACVLRVIEDEGSFSGLVWGYAEPLGPPPVVIPATTAGSAALAKDLRRRGFRFVGPTTVYAFMQSEGLVDDHLAGCWVREACEDTRRRVLAERGRRRGTPQPQPG
jgi:DNA-3-methyladenine glycosylase I